MRVGTDALYAGEVSYFGIDSDLTSHDCKLVCYKCEHDLSPRSSSGERLASEA